MEKRKNYLSNVSVKKEELIDIVKQNKEKHDFIYETALIGYNEACGRYLDKLQSETKRVQELAKDYAEKANFGKEFTPTGLYLIDCDEPDAPVNYEYEYNSTIKKLELSLADEISLGDKEFEQYVLNKWSWKAKFLESNSSYATNVTGGYSTSFNIGRQNVNQFGQLSFVDRGIALSGCLGSF